MAMAGTQFASQNLLPANATWLLSIKWVFPDAMNNCFEAQDVHQRAMK